MKMKAFYSLSEAAALLSGQDREAYDVYLQLLVHWARYGKHPLFSVKDVGGLPGGVSYMQIPGPNFEVSATDLRNWLIQNYPELRPAQLFSAPLQKKEGLTLYRTGTSGRPSSWNTLIKPEFERRWKAGENYPGKGGGHYKQDIHKWAEVLLLWLQQAHSSAPQPKEKALTNNLSNHFQTLKLRPKYPDIG